MKTIDILLELLLIAATRIVEWQERYNSALAENAASQTTIAAAAAELATAKAAIDANAVEIQSLKSSLDLATSDDAAIAAAEARAAELIEKFGAVIRGEAA